MPTIVVDSDANVVEVKRDIQPIQVVAESGNVNVVVETSAIGISVDTQPVQISSDIAAVAVSAPEHVVKVEAIGPRGAPGGGGRSEIFSFPVPAKTWVVTPDFLGSVVCIDSAGDVIEPGAISYYGNEITLDFSAAVSGTVYCFD
jgi:hypothetical protein